MERGGLSDKNVFVEMDDPSAMKWAVSSGIIQGYAGKLDSTGTASRAEVAAILLRLVGLLVGK